MSLQGSLETVALADVMRLLASTGKSGELEVRGDRPTGRLWFAEGRLAGRDVAAAVTPVDAVFELLRMSVGAFVFREGGEVPVPDEETDLEATMGVALGRLEEWRGIEAVVIGPGAHVGLVAEVDGEVRLSPEQWRTLTTVGDGRCVADVVARRGAGEFEGCREIKGLVDSGLLVVTPPEPVRDPAAGALSAPELEEPAGWTPESESHPTAAELVAAADLVASSEEPPVADEGLDFADPAEPALVAPDGEELRPIDGIRRRPLGAQTPAQDRPAEEGAPPDQPLAANGAEHLPQHSDGRPAPFPAEADGHRALTEPDEPDADAAGDGQSINRGLLLKFLSSVRT